MAARIEAAAYEARLFLAEAAGLQTSALISLTEEPVSQAVKARYLAWIERRVEGEPFQHILGETEFYGLPLKSDRRALIPRPDSECVVELALACLPKDQAVHIADLGTGSGCLLLALVHEHPQAIGFGLDRSSDAISLARENAALTGLHVRVDFAERDWANWAEWGQYDLIISNPPYIATADISGLARDVREHDPHQALDGGADGYTAYRQLILQAGQAMKPGAWLVFEIGSDQAETVCTLLKAAGFVELQLRQDLGGRDRAVAAKKN